MKYESQTIVMHGSRGLAGGARPDSNIDLSLIVDLPENLNGVERLHLLNSVFETTFQAWQADIEPDLAVIFESRTCGLRCFGRTRWQDCFGLYKVQEGFSGLVTHAGIRVQRMHPCLEIWRRGISRKPFFINRMTPFGAIPAIEAPESALSRCKQAD